MGQANAKQKAEVEMVIRDVKDIQSYIKRNTEDLDDVSKHNLHKRLIEYSDSLQNINNSLKNKNTKDLKDAIKFVSKVTEELLRLSSGQQLDLNSVETNSFVHLPTKQLKSGSTESLSKESRQSRSRKELISHDKYRVPSLDEIKNKTSSLKSEVEGSIRNEDLNQMLVQQKIIEILATDLELITYEPNSPLQETKSIIEKDLSLLYRKLEKNKNKIQKQMNSLRRQQKEAKVSSNELESICSKIDQLMTRALTQAKEKDLHELVKTKQEIIKLKEEVNNKNSSNNDVVKVKSEVEEKTNKLLRYLEKEICLINLEKINNDIDKTLSEAHLIVTENKNTELPQLRENVTDYRRALEEIINKDDAVVKLKIETSVKLNKVIQYLNQEINSPKKATSQAQKSLKRTEELLEECKKAIERFDGSIEETEFRTYQKHLDDLENVLQKIKNEDDDARQLKDICLRELVNTRKLLNKKHVKLENKYESKSTKGDNVDEKVNKIGSSTQDLQSDEEVILRKKHHASSKTLNEARNIDGFYSYWRDLQINLPATNCSLEELKQVATLLYEIECQIHAKRTKIGNFLKLKQINYQGSTELLNDSVSSINQTTFEKNRQVIDEIDSSAIKTNVVIYKLDQPKNLVIDDEKIIQSIEEINRSNKRVDKQTPERVVVARDSTSESSENETRTRNATAISPEENKNEHSIESSMLGSKPSTEEEMSQKDISKPRVSTKPKNSNKKHMLLNNSGAQASKSEDEENSKYKHIESIMQIQNICRDVEYLKEKAESFTGSKQTPKYADIKNRLDSYRKTLNILISYQNESVTLNCNRVLENIEEVFEILNKNIEKKITEKPAPLRKCNTIETMFTDIMNIKSQVDELSDRINKFVDPDDLSEYRSIKESLLKHRETINKIHVTSNYGVIASSKADVLNQINEYIYSLDFKLEENKFNKYQLTGRCSNIQKVLDDFEQVKCKIDRFSGSYKNVLYREIEKSAQKCLEEGANLTNDRMFLKKLNDDVSKYLRILQQKSIKEDSYSIGSSDSLKSLEKKNDVHEPSFDDIAIRLSRIRQNLKDIQDELVSPKHETVDLNSELDHRINLNILELSSMCIEADQPFYYDKETLKQEFAKLANTVRDNLLALNLLQIGEGTKKDVKRSTSCVAELELKLIEDSLPAIKECIDVFCDERNSTEFFDLDEQLTKISMQADKIVTNKGTDVHSRKKKLLKRIYDYCELLEHKAQSFEILQSIDGRINEAMYRLNNFQNLSAGDYSALYRELTDLDVALRDLNVGDNIVDKKTACQRNIQKTMRSIEDRMNGEEDCDSDDGTCV